MASEKNIVELTAATVEQAIDLGLEELGLTRTQVTVEILSHPRPGIFGIGGREAKVRITRLGYVAPEPVKVEEKPAPAKEIKKPEPKLSQPVAKAATESVSVPAVETAPVESDDDKAAAIACAVKVVTEMLEKMRITAEVKAHFVDPEDEMDEELLWVDIEGRDLSILIGRRSETLNALQYIASLIINKQVGRLVPLMVDVQGYRQRREQQIRQLALRMADQCVKSGRRQVLEPMSSNERRIVHLALRNHAEVYTESVGESPNRKVTILPKRK